MDKQIMDLSSCSSPPCTDFIDLMKNNHQTQRIGDNGLEEMVPSYDFQPLIRPTTAARVWSASDLKPISTCPSSHRGFASLEPDKDQNVSEIDRAMKKHTDTLLHVLEGVSARLTLLETTTHNLKLSLDKTHATTDGHMAHLNNVLVEVQTGVLLLKDKQEIVEAQLRLSSHQVSKVDQLPKTHSLHDLHPTALSPVPFPMHQMSPCPLSSFPQPPPSAPAPSSQLLAQLPTHFSPSPALTSYTPSSGYSPEEQPPYPLQSYPPNPPPQPQPSMYDGARRRSTSAFPSGYSSQPYPYTASPMPSAKPPHVTGYPHLSNGRVPIDDVIDRVTTMGFPREQVRATVTKLTENGQAVDLNVVLDKLMNQGRGAPPEVWFAGR